jgi:hypothetical protein
MIYSCGGVSVFFSCGSHWKKVERKNKKPFTGKSSSTRVSNKANYTGKTNERK